MRQDSSNEPEQTVNYDVGRVAGNDVAILFTTDFDSADVWTDEELPLLLNHQLETPVYVEVEGSLPESESNVDGGNAETVSFADILFAEAPSLDTLVRVKSYAKHGSKVGVPSKIAAVIYLSAISAALLRCGERITDAGDQELLAKLRWASRQDWVDQDTRSLLVEAALQLEPPPRSD